VTKINAVLHVFQEKLKLNHAAIVMENTIVLERKAEVVLVIVLGVLGLLVPPHLAAAR
jgi:hypothetical protein